MIEPRWPTVSFYGWIASNNCSSQYSRPSCMSLDHLVCLAHDCACPPEPRAPSYYYSFVCIVPKTCPICKKLKGNLKSVHKRFVSVIVQKHSLKEPLDYPRPIEEINVFQAHVRVSRFYWLFMGMEISGKKILFIWIFFKLI